MIYLRSCPICNNQIEYKNPRSFKWAERDKKCCRKCYTETMKKTIQKKLQNREKWGGVRDKEKEKKLIKLYKKKCPQCDTDMFYSRKDILNNSKKNNVICNRCSAYKYNKTFKNRINEEHIKQMRATKAGFSNWNEYVKNYPKKQFYKREVWKYTYRNDLSVLENFDKRGRCGVNGAYQIDHIISINYGWENNISAEEIGNIKNLKMISWQENRKKGK